MKSVLLGVFALCATICVIAFVTSAFLLLIPFYRHGTMVGRSFPVWLVIADRLSIIPFIVALVSGAALLGMIEEK